MAGVRKQRAMLDLLSAGLCMLLIIAVIVSDPGFNLKKSYIRPSKESVEAQCNESICVFLKNTFVENHTYAEPGPCLHDSTVINITCTRGFQQNGPRYQATCNGTTKKWDRDGSCDLDILSIAIATITMVIIVTVFGLFTLLLCKRGKVKRRRPMYDTSLDTSEVIDGHCEDGGVVNISMNELQPIPRVTTIGDPDEMDDEAGNTTPSDTSVPVDVHTSSEFALEDMLDGYGVIGENPLTPTDPQAGSSTEHLIDMTRDEPDGQATLEPYTADDRPMTRNFESETTVGGSVKVRPVTVPPSFMVSERSASVRNYGPKDSEVDVDALYAKINRVRRATSRWPPGQKDQKPAVSTDGRNHIDDAWKETEKYPTEPATGERIKEDLYAEVGLKNRNSVRSSKDEPSTSKEIPPQVAKKPKSQKAKHSGDHSALYARVDGSRHSSKSSILDSNFDPPSPPPIDGVDGLYAQIDRDRNSKEDLTKVGAADDDVRVE